MKVGIVIPNTPAYSETFFTSKIKGLQENGIEVVLFAHKSGNTFNLCKVNSALRIPNQSIFGFLIDIFRFLFLVITNYKSFKRFYYLEKQERKSNKIIFKNCYLFANMLSAKLNWLHFGYATMAIEKENIAKAINAKMAVSFRGFDINIYPLKNKNCYKLLWERVAKVHSISDYLLNEAYTLGLSKNTPYQIITPAVNVALFNKEIGDVINETITLKIVTVARLNWIKGLDYAIKAMELLKSKGVNFEYHIVGGGNMKEQERYKYQVHVLGLSSHVFFHNKLSHIETKKMILSSSVYLQPSLNEGFCNAVLEAQALGKFCIATNVGGIPENIINNETGWLIPSQNALSIANAIEKYKMLTSEYKNKLSNNSFQRVRKYFDLVDQQQKFINFYNS